MKDLCRTSLMTVLVAGLMVFSAVAAKADPVALTTSGTFNGSGHDTITFFCGIGCTTSLSLYGTNTAGAHFGELQVLSTASPSSIGSTITGDFTLNFFQTVGTDVLVGALSGTLGFNSGIGTLTFANTSVNIGGMVYTANPSYTLALPVPGSVGPGITAIEGTMGPALPEPTALLLLGTGLAGVAGLVRRKLKAGN